MTRYETLLTDIVAREIKGATPRKAAIHLLAAGLLDLRACEQHILHSHVTRLSREGVGRCEAMRITAGILCCSYEKVRRLYYNYYNTKSK